MRALLECRWSLSDGIAAIRLHSIVESFASEFTSFYLSWLQKHSKCQHENPPYMQELTRIKRALYRFETYCRLFPPTNVLEDCDKPRAAQMSFLSSFSPWEREQLASVHESLWRQVAPAFNDIALHDIYWGAFRTSCVDEFDDPYTESILSRGLRSIYSLSRAETYSQRHQLLGCKIPNATTEFLHDAFACYNHMVLKSDYLATANRRPQQPSMPFDSDPDLGPERAWKWSHPDESRTEFSNEAEYVFERACGYVFWDEERLVRNGLLNTHWIDTTIEMEESVAALVPTLREQQESWKARSALFEKRILGYWKGMEDRLAVQD